MATLLDKYLSFPAVINMKYLGSTYVPASSILYLVFVVTVMIWTYQCSKAVVGGTTGPAMAGPLFGRKWFWPDHFLAEDKEDTLKLQRDIDRLGNWARKWGMRFQPVKCNMMQLTDKHSNKIQASYTLEGTVLENVNNIKYLGVTVTAR